MGPVWSAEPPPGEPETTPAQFKDVLREPNFLLMYLTGTLGTVATAVRHQAKRSGAEQTSLRGAQLVQRAT